MSTNRPKSLGWRWFLYTPTRLLVSVGIVVALIAAGATALALGGGHPGPAQAAGTGLGPSPSLPATPATQIPMPGASNAQPAGLPATTAAADFVAAWAGHQASQDAWLKAMAPFASQELLSQMSSTVPDAVPATKVTGPGRSVDTSGGNLTVIVVPTDAGAVSVKLEHIPTGWVADDIEPGDQAGN